MENKAYSDREDSDVEVTTFGRMSDDEKDEDTKVHVDKNVYDNVLEAKDSKRLSISSSDRHSNGDSVSAKKFPLDELELAGQDRVVVEVDESRSSIDKPYADMGKEDLLKFSNTPFWNRFRLITILLFWAAWLALLGAVIGLTIVAPRCGDPPQPDWWQKSVIYQIYVRSFYDTDGDGVGDIKGVTSKLEYLKTLNVTSILLSSVYDAHMDSRSDYGYEIIDHTNVHSVYGTLDDLDELINATHTNGIKILLDFIPNYTGSRHQWFNASSNSSGYSNPYWNYYVWADCDGRNGSWPNNWTSVYGEPAWSYSSQRLQCYLHQFLPDQPELNLRSTAVQTELENILRFWLDRGVDGFRINKVSYLFESADFTNEMYNTNLCTNSNNQYDCYDHKMTRSLPETYDIVARWRQIVDEYTLKTPEQSRVLITDADVGTSDSLRYYKSGAHLPINFALTDLISATMNGTELSELLHSWLDGLPADDPNATATWLTGDQDRSRLGSYIDARYVNVINMLKLTLPGTAFVYYGEEIGMTNSNFTTNQQDPAGDIDLKFSRDPYRTPMQWTNNNDHAGFINESVYRPTSPPWLPVNLYPYNNVSVSVESQQNETDGGSVGLIKNLTILRNTEGSLRFGKIHFTYTTGNIFSFVREHQGFDRILVLLNVGQSPEESFDLTKQKYTISIPSEATIILTTNSSMSLAEGDQINLRKLYVDPGNGFIARWPYTRPLN